MSLGVILYSRPNGKKVNVEITKIDDEDAQFFKTNNIQVSMEDHIALGFIVYGCPRSDLSEDREVMIIAGKCGLSCREAMKSLREEGESFWGVGND